MPEARSDGARETPAQTDSAGPGDIPLEPCLSLVQGALDGLARPLAETEFVVVDLETTGGSPADAAITEIGAVRTRQEGRGGTDAPGSEFAALVNPGRAIPPHVAALTGITDALVAAAPPAEEVLPRFIEFAAGSVLVAHNAPFDIGFLKAACARHNLTWPALPTLDTAALARRMLTTDEVNDCRLGTLADFFAATTRPSHRALDDAHATAAVLHGLLDRLERRGVHTLEALHGFGLPPAPERRRMRLLTATIPRTPGVCVFVGADGQVLHVVRSSDMHARACGYFAAAEARREIREMISKTARILPLSCATALEAEVAEIRLIAVHRPPLCTGRQLRGDGADTTGAARRVRSAPPGGPAHDSPAHDSPAHDSPAHDSPAHDSGSPAHGGPAHSGVERPGGDTPDLAVQPLAAARCVVAARPRFAGGWDVAWIGNGLLEATAVLPRGAMPPACERAHKTGSLLGQVMPCAVPPASPATAGAGSAETACLVSWLESPGVRLIRVEGTWCSRVPP